jgi:hypothetical protein
LFLVLFLNVKSSLSKIYSVANATKAIFDFICITILYLLVNVYVRIGVSLAIFSLLLFVSAFVLLIFSLKLHRRMGVIEFGISILSSLFIVLLTAIFWNTNIFVNPH